MSPRETKDLSRMDTTSASTDSRTAPTDVNVIRAAANYFGTGRCSGHEQFNGVYCRYAAGPERWCIHCAGFMLMAEHERFLAGLEHRIDEWKGSSARSRKNADNESCATGDRRQCFGVSQAYKQCADELETLVNAGATPLAEGATEYAQKFSSFSTLPKARA